jgi:hypothetical protein
VRGAGGSARRRLQWIMLGLFLCIAMPARRSARRRMTESMASRADTDARLAAGWYGRMEMGATGPVMQVEKILCHCEIHPGVPRDRGMGCDR